MQLTEAWYQELREETGERTLSTACATPSSAGRWADRRHGFDHAHSQRLNGHLRGPRKLTRGRSQLQRQGQAVAAAYCAAGQKAS